jgi:hypothetical protein
MNVGGPLTGLNGMTLYVHFVASGPANASLAWEHGETPIWWYPEGASHNHIHCPEPKVRLTAESQRGIE